MPAILTAPTTDKQLSQEVRALGLTIRKDSGEYRIAHPIAQARAGRPALSRARATSEQERSAYYTNDRADAYNTAITMSRTPEGARLRAVRARAAQPAGATRPDIFDTATPAQYPAAISQTYHRIDRAGLAQATQAILADAGLDQSAAQAMLDRDPAEILRSAADHMRRALAAPHALAAHFALQRMARAVSATQAAAEQLAAAQYVTRHART